MRTTILAVTIAFAASSHAAAQDAPVNLSTAMESMPDHTRYRVELVPSDLPVQQQQMLATMVGEAAHGQHFYGAIYGFRPASGGETKYEMRSKLHSRDAARRAALSDCEAARSPGDAECSLVGEILPESWSEETPQLHHFAVQALNETRDELPGNVVVARSRDGDGFEIRSGDDVRDATLDACNAANAQAGLPEDCEIVIDDPASD